jgi:ribulose-phosphate 3-epimerase
MGHILEERKNQVSVAGADVLVEGNAVFKAPDMVDMIRQMKNLK